MKRKILLSGVVLLCLIFFQSCKNMDNEGYAPGDLKSADYQEGFDDQKYFSDNKICKSSQGYYFFRTPYLFFFDEKSGTTVKVCGLPDCKHNDKSCNAFFDPQLYDTSSIWFYNEHLYIEGVEEKDKKTHFLYQLSQDGGERKQICYLFKTEKFLDYSLMIHRGYAYYCNNEKNDLTNDSYILYRVKLTNGSKPEEVYRYHGVGASIYRIRGYGNQIYFQAGAYKDKQGNSYSSNLYRMDISSDSVETVLEDVWPNDYFISDNNLYYFTKDNKLIQKNLDTKEETELYQSTYRSDLSYDGKHIFIDNGMELQITRKELANREICVLDMAGKKVDTIKLSNATECFFGDDKYLFAVFDGVLKAFEKNQIGKETKEWLLLQ